jgi:uncharacterized protein YceK
MCKAVIVLAVLAAVAPLGGCAATNNLFGKDGRKFYGGTQVDASLMSQGFAQDTDDKDQALERPVVVWAGCCGLVDMPFSIIADTLMLPVTVPSTLSRPGKEASEDSSE